MRSPGIQGHDRFLPLCFAAIDPATAARSDPGFGLAFHHHGVDRQNPDIEGLLDRFPDLNLIGLQINLEGVLALFHQIRVLLGDMRSAQNLFNREAQPFSATLSAFAANRAALNELGSRRSSGNARMPSITRQRFLGEDNAIVLQQITHIQVTCMERLHVWQVVRRPGHGVRSVGDDQEKRP